jgi:integrase
VIDLRDPLRPANRKGRAAVPIAEWVRPALDEAHRGALSDHVIEWGAQRVSSIKKGFTGAVRRAGLGPDVTPHVLRHTAAVWMAEDGVPMDEIAQYLGHTDSRTTYRVYARFSPDHLRRASKALEL